MLHGQMREDIEFLGRVIERAWNEVADDMFFDDQGKKDYTKTFSRAEVAEIALDCRRYDDSVYTKEELVKIDKLVKWFYALKDSEREEVLKEALHYQVYGY